VVVTVIEASHRALENKIQSAKTVMALSVSFKRLLTHGMKMQSITQTTQAHRIHQVKCSVVTLRWRKSHAMKYVAASTV
jgi:hypothetical protein